MERRLAWAESRGCRHGVDTCLVRPEAADTMLTSRTVSRQLAWLATLGSEASWCRSEASCGVGGRLAVSPATCCEPGLSSEYSVSTGNAARGRGPGREMLELEELVVVIVNIPESCAVSEG